MKPTSILALILFLGVVAVFFILFGPFGFNPTDDGMVLAAARRIAEGQVPHLHFISIRPAGSALLHLPDLLLGGDYTFLISRLIVTLQLAMIAFCSVQFLKRYLELQLHFAASALLYVLSFFLTVNSFPLMAWSTIDALFVISLGLYLLGCNNGFLKNAGSLCIGFAVLCKQNFLPVPFVILVALGEYKSISRWLYMLMPSMVYLEWIYFAGAWPDFKMQIMARSELIQVGLIQPFQHKALWLALFGALLLALLHKLRSKLPAYSSLLAVGIVGGLAIVVFVMLFKNNAYRASAYCLWGVIIGLTVYEAITFKASRLRNALWIVLVLAWCTGISIGYTTPILAAGWMWVCLLFYVLLRFEPTIQLSAVLAACVLIAAPLFYQIRSQHIYRQGALKTLTYPLGKIAYGFQGIYSDKQTFACLRELQLLTQKYPSGHFLLFDFAGFRATHRLVNALPVDWIGSGELPTPALQEKVKAGLFSNRKTRYVFIQKYCTDVIGQQRLPIEALQDSFCLKFRTAVMESTIKYDEHEFFDVYRR